MSIQVCLNGREYLAKQLDRQGIGYEKRDNCFVRIDDIPRAQKILDRLEVAMRKGVVDFRRRAAIGRVSNERYLQALAVVGASAPTQHLRFIRLFIVVPGRDHRRDKSVG